MYPTYAKLLSVLLVIAYYYKKTKDKISLWIISYTFFLIACAILFRKLFPNIPFVSPTIEYMGFLIIVGVPFLVLIVLVAVELDKRKKKKAEEEGADFTILFKLSKDNIIFWAIIVLLNLAGLLMGGNK